MDSQLWLALVILWFSSTAALVIFLAMWFTNRLEAFHPHCVDVEHRHTFFLVVNSATLCKKDHAIKSISAFVAPRGASSSKHFTVLCVMIAITGMLGCSRWFYVGDAATLEASLAGCGFASLLLVAAFELDVGPATFLEDKMIVTAWLIRKLRLDDNLPFRLSPTCPGFLHFLRNSPEIYCLYDEDRILQHRKKMKKVRMWNYHPLWGTMHMVGAVLYVFLIPAAIVLNEQAEASVVALTFLFFSIFSFMGYLTGNYFPVNLYMQGWLLSWNPFVKEPHFMLKLKRSVEKYIENYEDGVLPAMSAATQTQSAITAADEPLNAKRRRSSGGSRGVGGHGKDEYMSLGSAAERGHTFRTEKLQALLEHDERRDGCESDAAARSDIKNGNDSDVSSYNEGTSSRRHGNTIDGNIKGKDFATLESRSHRQHNTESQKSSTTSTELIGGGKSGPKKRQRRASQQQKLFRAESLEADAALDNVFLRYARSNPVEYLHAVGVVMVMSEMLALLTPAVGMGIQWITALCDVPPVPALLNLFYLAFLCARSGGTQCSIEDTPELAHCILQHAAVMECQG